MQEAIDCSVDPLPPEEEVDEEEGAGKKRKVSTDITLIDLFHKKRVKGWWPVFTSEEGERELTVYTRNSVKHALSPSPSLSHHRASWRWR